MSSHNNHNSSKKPITKQIICKSEHGISLADYNDEPGVFYVLDSWDGVQGSFLYRDETFSSADTDELAAHINANINAVAID